MGAVVNLRPELFKGVVADVPFVDVVTTMLDASIPLTDRRVRRVGQSRTTRSTTTTCCRTRPTTTSRRKGYPNLLVTTGLHDSQVQYCEPAKWVAKLRALKTDKNPLLLKTNMEAGHGGVIRPLPQAPRDGHGVRLHARSGRDQGVAADV